MLQLTHAAAAQLAEARQAEGFPETVGVRVFGERRAEGELAVSLTFAEVPAEDDQVTERDGTRVFVAPEVQGALESVALDVEQTADGSKLVLTPQEPGAGI
jgi:Fe-S cluster assembly iron-binding protein IscA